MHGQKQLWCRVLDVFRIIINTSIVTAEIPIDLSNHRDADNQTASQYMGARGLLVSVVTM